MAILVIVQPAPVPCKQQMRAARARLTSASLQFLPANPCSDAFSLAVVTSEGMLLNYRCFSCYWGTSPRAFLEGECRLLGPPGGTGGGSGGGR